MGHIVNSEREYRLLQQRLDMNVTGAPYSPVFMDILKLLFTPGEAEMARQIPLRPAPLQQLAAKLGRAEEDLREQISSMAQRGLVFDLEYNGTVYVALAPVVIGFFEFVYMRTRDELPMKELSKLFDSYMKDDERFARSIFEGSTQIGRALVREEALPEGDYSEVLDWERSSAIIENAGTIGLSLCACRHKAEHIGKACSAPQKTCFTFGSSAELLIRNGMAEAVSKDTGLAILAECKKLGLAQIGDNVQNNVGFICNCCGCCCGMFQSIRTFDMKNAVVSSNWLAAVTEADCTGCGLCAKACPVLALDCDGEKMSNGRHKARLAEELCLGCGVCISACRKGCLTLKPRPKRVFVPENTFDRIIRMAIERGKLANYIFDDPSRFSHRALGRIASLLENSPPVKGLLAVESIRSAFARSIVQKTQKYGK